MHKPIKQVNIFSSVDKYWAVLSFGILSKVSSRRNRRLFIGLDYKVSMMGSRKLRGDLATEEGQMATMGEGRRQRLEHKQKMARINYLFFITECQLFYLIV